MLDHRVTPADTELQKTKKFIHAWSHDIGNLVSSLRGSYEELSNLELPPEIVDWVNIIGVLSQQMEDVNANIRAFSIAGHHSHFDYYRISEIVEPIVKIYQKIAEKNITIVLNNRCTLDFIRTDKLKLTHVLSNLIVNAVKFSPYNSFVFVEIANAGGYIKFEVIDSGIGIPEDKIDEIFHPYVRLNSDYRGTGLGLTICKQHVEGDLNGNISVCSIPNQKTTFKVLLPI